MGDPTASLDATELLLAHLIKRLRAKWPLLSKTDACHDAAVEVFVMYLQAPERYDPTRSSVLGWLTMQAHGDLLNDHASKQKDFNRRIIFESAMRPDPETGQVPRVGDDVPSFDPVTGIDYASVLRAVRDAFPDERDRKLVWLMYVEGSRSTDDAAAVLGLNDLPLPERTAAVKRHKDRVVQRLRRLGLDNRHD